MPCPRPEAVSLDGQVVVLHAGSSILHYAHGIRTGEASIPSPSWDIALSKNGHHSAVSMSTPSRVMVFLDGAVVRTLTTGLEYTTSIAVDDLGELAVGGQANDGTSTVLLFDASGQEAMRCEGAKTDAASNPYVLLEPGGIALLTYYPKGMRLSRLAH
jgi:hypothetical protein